MSIDVEARQLVRELIETVHQTGSLRDHADPNDKTGWNVHGVETCQDSLCMDGLAFLARFVPAEDEGWIEHALGCPLRDHPNDETAPACTCRRAEDEVAVRRDTGGVFADGTTNHPPIDFDASNEPVPAEDEGRLRGLPIPVPFTPKQVRVMEHKHRRRKNTVICDGCEKRWQCDSARLVSTINANRAAALAATPEPRPGADWTDPKG